MDAVLLKERRLGSGGGVKLLLARQRIENRNGKRRIELRLGAAQGGVDWKVEREGRLVGVLIRGVVVVEEDGRRGVGVGIDVGVVCEEDVVEMRARCATPRIVELFLEDHAS